MKFAKIVFRIAGIWGLLVTAPLYFFANTIGRQSPPALTHLEFYYGFVGVTLVWQIAFFVIASNPLRFRPFILVSIFEKLSYILAIVILYVQHLVPANQLLWAGTDSILCLFFIAAYIKTTTSSPTN